MKQYFKLFQINIDEDNYDDEDLVDDFELLKNMLRIRDLNMIFNHEILIEKEMILLLGADLPEPKPFFLKLDWNALKEFKTQINDGKKFDYKKIGLDKSTINEINSLFSSFFEKFSEDKYKMNIKAAKKENEAENISLTQDKKCNSANNNKNECKKSTNIFSSLIAGEEQKKNKSANQNEINLSMIENDFPPNFIKPDDFRMNEDIENLEFNYYIPDNKTVGTLFAGDVTNYIYDLFNLLTLGKVSFYRNERYEEKYELDFQLTNIKFNDFLYFIALLLPNIPTLETLKIENIKSIFQEKENIFQNISKYKLDAKHKEYEFIDILGEITIDLLNIENKKLKQLKSYIALINELKKNKSLNEKYRFSPNNKKVIIIITDGKVEKFFKYFNPENKYNKFKFIREEENIDHIFIYVNSKNNNLDSVIQEKVKFHYIKLLEESLKEKSNSNNIKDNSSKINKFQKLNFSEIYTEFYRKIIYSKKYDSLHQKIKIIISKYIKNTGTLYINFLKKNIDKEEVIKKFLKSLDLSIIQKKNILEDLRKEYNKNENTIIPNVSILELSTIELKYNNYKKKDINIINYEGQKYSKIQNIIKFFEILGKKIDLWKSKMNDCSERIIIYDTDENDINIYAINRIFMQEEFKDISFLFNIKIKELSKIYKFNKVAYFSNNDEKEKIVLDIAKRDKLRQFAFAKLTNKFSYFDKVLKHRIIVNDKIGLPNDYLDQLMIKINQTISIYANNDISKFNVVSFKDDIKNFINQNNNYHDAFIDIISSQIEKTLSDCFNKKSISKPDLREYFTNKYNKKKDYLTIIYYKYYERIFSHFIKKKIKKLIINYITQFDGEK